MNKKIFYAKIIGSQLVAFLVSMYLVSNVFLGPLPIVRSDVKQEIAKSPEKIVAFAREAPAKIAAFIKTSDVITQKKNTGQSGTHIPPPWVFENGPTPLPTTARIPDGNNEPNEPQPTSAGLPTLPPLPTLSPIQKPTSVQQKPTIFPTNIPLPTTPPSRPSGGSGGTGGGQQNGSASLERQVVDEINRRRKEVGLRELKINNELTQASRRHSADMSATSSCGHQGSDGSSPFDRAKDAGYAGRAYGETVACGTRTPVAAVDAWWGSPPHHAILTNSSVTVIGLGWVNTHQTAVVGF